MPLNMKAMKGKTVFEYTTEDMSASWTLSVEDSGPAIVKKLARMLEFMRTQEGVAPAAPMAPVYQLPLPGPVPANGWPPVGGVREATPLPFTGTAPVQPAPLADSIAKAEALGWELYTLDNTDD